MTLRRRLLQTALWAVLPALLVLAAGVAGTRLVDRPFSLFVRDVTITAELPFYAGGLTELTVMVWTAGAAVAIAAALADGLPRRGSSPLVQLLLPVGLLTLAFGVDDQFRVHETVAPRLGIPEDAVLATYAVVATVTAVRSRAVLRSRPEGALLVVAAGLLAGSVAVDFVAGEVELNETLRLLVEDGLKLVGAAVWGAACMGLAAEAWREPRVLE